MIPVRLTFLIGLVFLGACTHSNNASTGTVTGRVVLGPVANGTLNIYPVGAGGVVGSSVVATAQTDGNGNARVALTQNGVYLARAVSGNYTDESTGKVVSLSPAGVSGMFVYKGGVFTFAVTHLTDLIATGALATGGDPAQALATWQAKISRAFNVPPGIDPNGVPGPDGKGSTQENYLRSMATTMSFLVQQPNAISKIVDDLRINGVLAPEQLAIVNDAIVKGNDKDPVFPLAACVGGAPTPVPNDQKIEIAPNDKLERLAAIDLIHPQMVDLFQNQADADAFKAKLQQTWAEGLPLGDLAEGFVPFEQNQQLPLVNFDAVSQEADETRLALRNKMLRTSPAGGAPVERVRFGCPAPACPNSCPGGYAPIHLNRPIPGVKRACIMRLKPCRGCVAGTNTCVVMFLVNNDCSHTIRFRKCDEGCFSQDTKVTLADRTTKLISMLKPGNMLWNPIRKRAVRLKGVTAGPEKEDLYVFSTADKTIKVTKDHPMWTPHGVVAAEDIATGDELVLANGTRARVLAIERASTGVEFVWNVELDVSSTDPRDHMVEAQGVVTADYTIQKTLVADKKKKRKPLP